MGAGIAHLHLHHVIATLVLDEGAKGRETGKEGNRGTDIQDSSRWEIMGRCPVWSKTNTLTTSGNSKIEHQHCINTHVTRLLSITTHFRWVEGNLFLRAPNGSLFGLLQQCPLKIQQCILMLHLAPSKGSSPTSRRQEMLSHPSIPKHRYLQPSVILTFRYGFIS